MNYNLIFINKCKKLLDERKFNLPPSVYYFYKNSQIHQKRDITNLHDLSNEIKCLLNVLDNLDWKENYLLTLTREDIFLNKGYKKILFKDELLSPTYEHKDINKLVNLAKEPVEKILSLPPSIIIRIKKEGYNICDGYHRIISALVKQKTITFLCTVGLIKS